MSEEIKCVFLGDSGVGKTCILNYFVNGSFSKDSTPTIGAAYVSKTIYCDKKQCDLMIWDTAGQEMYRGLAPMYYRNAFAAIFVFDTTNPKSFDNIRDHWLQELHDVNGDDTIIFLVENKIDLSDSSFQNFSSFDNFAKENGFASYFRVSAKEGEGINELFASVAAICLEEIKRKKQDEENATNLSLSPEPKNSFGQCQC